MKGKNLDAKSVQAVTGWEFGPYQLPDNGLPLQGPNGDIALEPRQRKLLLYFLTHPGQVLSLQQLVQEVWEGIVISDGAVQFAISQLRKALGDSAQRPAYVRTLPRQGYLWLMPAERIGTALPVTPRSSDPLPSVALSSALPPPASPLFEAPVMVTDDRAAGVHRPAGLPTRRWVARVAGVLMLGLLVWAGYVHQSRSSVAESRLLLLPITAASPDLQPLAESLTAELTYQMANVAALQVIAPGMQALVIDRQEAVRRWPAASLLSGKLEVVGEGWELQLQLSRGDELLLERRERSAKAGSVPPLQDLAAALLQSLGHGLPEDVPPQTHPDAHTRYLLGRRALAQRSPAGLEQAASHFQASLVVDPAYWPARSGLSDVESLRFYYDREQASVEKAKAALLALQVMAPDAAMTAASRGLHAFHMGQLDDARSALEIALRRAPGSPDVQMLLGRTLLMQSMAYLPRARSLFEQAVARAPLFGMAHVNLALAQEFSGDLQAADASFATATEVEPGLASAWWGRAFLAGERGQDEIALAHYRRALQVNPALSPQIGLSIANYLADAGLWSDADRWYRQAAQFDGDHHEQWLGWFQRVAFAGLPPPAVPPKGEAAREQWALLQAHLQAIAGRCQDALPVYQRMSAQGSAARGLWNADDARRGQMGALYAIHCARTVGEAALADEWLARTRRFRAEHAAEQFAGWRYLDAGVALLSGDHAQAVREWQAAADQGWMQLDGWRVDPVWQGHHALIKTAQRQAVEARRREFARRYAASALSAPSS